jgi:hypothetical protein
MTTHIVRSAEDMERVARLVGNLKPPITITVTSGASRSIEQNKLQRLWCMEAAEQLGDRTAEEVRGFCKLHYGVPIMRDGHEDFRETYDRLIKPLPYETKLAFMMEPLDLPITRLMTVGEKSQYLDAMHKGLSELGVKLTEPSE